MKNLLALLPFLFAIQLFHAQTTEIDSLQNVVKTSTNDSIKMDAFNKLRRVTYYQNPDTSRHYTIKYLEFARKRKDSHNIVLAHFFLGNAKVIQGDYTSAMTDYLIGADYYEAQKDSARLTSVFSSIGVVQEKINNDSLALVYNSRAKNIANQLGDIRRSAIASVNNGNIFIRQKKYKEAISNLEEAKVKFGDNPNYKAFLNITNLNLAQAYRQNKNLIKSQNLYSQLVNEIDSINDSYNYANVLRGLSELRTDQKKNKEALNYGKKAFKIYTVNNFNDERMQMFPELIDLYRTEGQPDQALKLYDEYQVVKDSLLNVETTKNIADAVQKYETEKKDAQLQVMTLENEKAAQQQKLYLYLALIGLISVLIIGFFLYKNNQKNALLAKQKQKLEVTIDEKNTLLKETHHRVKNSFQIVSSLLYLQSENIEDKEAQIAVKEAQNRVRSMVLIHQKLYNKDQLVGINTQEYFEDLTKDILESHQSQEQNISYDLNVTPIVLGIETITPIGLILNELITNCLKHAFANSSSDNKVSINFREERNTLVLEVIDNGTGIQGEVNASSFGIKLIRALSKKLKATLEYDKIQPKGTRAALAINRYEKL